MLKCTAPKNSEELEQYYQLRWEVLRKPWEQPIGSERDDIEAQAFHRVIIDTNQVVGVARLHKYSQEKAQVRYMAVKSNVQGKGYGKKLLEELENTAAQLGVKTIELNARTEAIGFYQQLGYVDQGYCHTLYDHIRHHKMLKTIVKPVSHLAELAENLQAVWHRTIPLSKAMNINICYFNQQTLLTNCEPNFNKNLHNTMFAGSIYTLATLTGWGWVYLALQAQSLDADIVLAEGNIRYLAPLAGVAHAKTAQHLVTGDMQPLKRGKNARIRIDVEVYCGDNVVAIFTGAFVAKVKR